MRPPSPGRPDAPELETAPTMTTVRTRRRRAFLLGAASMLLVWAGTVAAWAFLDGDRSDGLVVSGAEHQHVVVGGASGLTISGSLTVPLHNKWADAAIALQKEKYPNMELVADRFGVAESMDDSYRTALDQMRANPDLKGILAGRTAFYSKAEFSLDTSAQALEPTFMALRTLVRGALRLPVVQ